VFEEDPLEFLSLDDVVERDMADNIDMEDDWSLEGQDKTTASKSNNSTSQQKAALRFAFSLGSTSNGSMSASQVTSMDLPSVDNPRINGSDFRMNSCFLSSAGALMLGSSMDLLASSLGTGPLGSFSGSSLSLLSPSRQPMAGTSLAMSADDGMTSNLQGPLATSSQNAEPNTGDWDVEMGAMAGGADSDSDDGHFDNLLDYGPQANGSSNLLGNDVPNGSSGMDGVEGEHGQVEGDSSPQGAKKLDHNDRQILRSIVDPWLMHDPHDPGTIAAKPFHRGRPYRIPKKKSTKDEKKTPLDPLSDDFVAGVALLDLNIALNKPFFPEFTYMFDQESKKRQAERLKQRREAIVAEAARGGVFVEESHLKLPENEEDETTNSNRNREDDGLVVSFGDYNGTGVPSGDGQDWDPVGGAMAGGPDSDDDDDRGYNYEDNMLDYGPARDTFGPDAATTDATELTYEEHCKLRLEEYFRSAQLWVQETELSSRIEEWSNRLAPRLLEQEARPPFDIHDYGTRLINKVQEVGTEEDRIAAVSESSKTCSAEPLSVANFADLFAGQPSYEVSRTFSSMLQLANMGNIKIVPSRSQPGGLHDITLHLLSAEPRVDLDTIARTQPSFDELGPEEAPPKASKNKPKAAAKKAAPKRAGFKASR
jgi:hypothetical protein